MIVIISKIDVTRNMGQMVDAQVVGEPIIIRDRNATRVTNRAMVQIRQFITHGQSFTAEVVK